MGQIRKKETSQAFISLTSKENKCCCSLVSTKKAPSKKNLPFPVCFTARWVSKQLGR